MEKGIMKRSFLGIILISTIANCAHASHSELSKRVNAFLPGQATTILEELQKLKDNLSVLLATSLGHKIFRNDPLDAEDLQAITKYLQNIVDEIVKGNIKNEESITYVAKLITFGQDKLKARHSEGQFSAFLIQLSRNGKLPESPYPVESPSSNKVGSRGRGSTPILTNKPGTYVDDIVHEEIHVVTASDEDTAGEPDQKDENLAHEAQPSDEEAQMSRQEQRRAEKEAAENRRKAEEQAKALAQQLEDERVEKRRKSKRG